MKNIKLGSVVYNKLLLQAKEAKNQNLNKLSNGILSVLNQDFSDENITYCYSDLNNDVYCGLWKLASNFIKYYNLESVDAKKVDEIIEVISSKFINEMELTLNVDNIIIGPFESVVPGENK